MEHFLRKVCHHDVTIVSIFYSLAPENPFPAAIHDCYSVLFWLNNEIKQKNHEFTQKISKIIIGGDSAGGNLASVMCLLNRDEKLGLDIKHQILLYPGYHYSNKDSKYQYLIPTEIRNFFGKSYYGDNDLEELKKSKLINPINSSDGLFGLPNALIITATYDPLKNDGIIYSNALREHKVNVKHINYDTIHGFCTLNFAPYYKECFDEIIKIILSDY
jgi:acetyl esterase